MSGSPSSIAAAAGTHLFCQALGGCCELALSHNASAAGDQMTLEQAIPPVELGGSTSAHKGGSVDDSLPGAVISSLCGVAARQLPASGGAGDCLGRSMSAHKHRAGGRCPVRHSVALVLEHTPWAGCPRAVAACTRYLLGQLLGMLGCSGADSHMHLVVCMA